MKLRKMLSVLFALVLVAGVLAATACGGPAEQEEEEEEEERIVKFANLVALSGDGAPWGIMNQATVDLAVEDINAAGGIEVGGEHYMIEMYTYDNKMDPAESLTISRKAIYDEGIKFHHIMTANEALASSELCTEEKVIQLVQGPGKDFLGPEYPYNFRCIHDYKDAQDVLYEYLRQEYPELTKFAGINPDESMGWEAGECMEAAAIDAGLEVVDLVYLPYGTTDYYPVLTDLMDKGVDIIDICATDPGAKGLIIKQADELDFEGKIVDSDGIDLSVIPDICGWEAMEGMVACPQFIEMPTEIGKSWAERFEERTGSSLKGWPALSYDGVRLLAIAIEEADTFDVDEVVAALGEVSYLGCFGETSFQGEEVVGLDRYPVFEMDVAEVQNGELVKVHSGWGLRWR